jgi:predicted MPP superfamily phosphohydrolase
MRPLLAIALLLFFMIAMDLYALRGIHFLLAPGRNAGMLFIYLYWGVTLLMFLAIIRAGTMFRQLRDPSRFFGVMLIVGFFLMLYLPKMFFNASQLLGDLSALVTRVLGHPAGIIRKVFLVPGGIIGMLLFIALGVGMARGRTNVKVFRENIQIKDLPASFSGLRIIQLSDIHLAGFYNHPGYIRKVVEMVNKLEPDLILFTGDMVHNFAEETDPFVDILDSLKAPLGKFAILGNHDYGKYFSWNSKEEEAANLERVKEQIRKCGFDLLLNEHRILSLNGDSLELVGVENWGKPPFPQFGDLHKAMEGTNGDLVKILLSHDPSHWDLQVLGKEDIDLTLAGHTHGMQFGIEIGNFRWSPSKWTYKHWGGLYKIDGQQLYVNRGLGYTGFPGRVGIRPEITLLTLKQTPS